MVNINDSIAGKLVVEWVDIIAALGQEYSSTYLLASFPLLGLLSTLLLLTLALFEQSFRHKNVIVCRYAPIPQDMSVGP